MAETYAGALWFDTEIVTDKLTPGLKKIEADFKSASDKIMTDYNSAVSKTLRNSMGDVQEVASSMQNALHDVADAAGGTVDDFSKIYTHFQKYGQEMSASFVQIVEDGTASLEDLRDILAKNFEETGVSWDTAEKAAEKYIETLKKTDSATLNALKKERDATSKALVKDMEKVKKAALDNAKAHEKAAKKVKSSWEETSAVLKRVGAAIGGMAAVYKFVGLMKNAYTEAQNASRELALLEVRMKSTGNTAGKTSEEYLKMADALEATTNIASGSATNAISRLLEFSSIVPENFERAFKLSADYAESYMAGDMVGAAEVLGRALEDPISGMGMLQKQGFKLTDEQKRQVKSFQELGQTAKAQKIILDMVSESIAGTAEATKDTATQLSNAFNSALALVGKEIRDRLNPSLGELKNLVNENKEGFVGLGKAVGVVTELGGYAVIGLTDTVSKLGKAYNLYYDGYISFWEYVTASDKDIERYEKTRVKNLELTASAQARRNVQLEKEQQAQEAVNKTLSEYEKAKTKFLTTDEINQKELDIKITSDPFKNLWLDYQKQMREALNAGEEYWKNNNEKIDAIYFKNQQTLQKKISDEKAKTLQDYQKLERDAEVSASGDRIAQINAEFDEKIASLKEYEKAGIDTSKAALAAERLRIKELTEYEIDRNEEVLNIKKENADIVARLVRGSTHYQMMQETLAYENYKIMLTDSVEDTETRNKAIEELEKIHQENMERIRKGQSPLPYDGKSSDQIGENDKFSGNQIYSDLLTSGIQQGISGISGALGTLFEQLYDGQNAWKAFGQAGVNVLASLLESLGQTLFAQAAAQMILGALGLEGGTKEYGKAGAAMAAGAAAMAAAGALKAIKFAGGGIVPGSSRIGDNIIARVNSGEMVLNTEQQARLFAMANGGLPQSRSEKPMNVNIVNNAGAEVSANYDQNNGMLEVLIERQVLKTTAGRKSSNQMSQLYGFHKQPLRRG